LACKEKKKEVGAGGKRARKKKKNVPEKAEGEPDGGGKTLPHHFERESRTSVQRKSQAILFKREGARIPKEDG